MPDHERPRTICHVDMDAFFVSVELRRRPELKGKPVVVGGVGRRGVVAAASYEARRYGVFSAMPSVAAQRRCPDAIFLPGDHSLYASVSRDVHEILGRYTPLIEPLSLDEAFLDVTGARRLFGDGVTIGHRIRDEIANELELSCSVGVAANKFIAKLASVEAKPRVVAADRGAPSKVVPGHGVFEVVAGLERDFLVPLDVSRLWGVGPKSLARLHSLGFRTVGDLLAAGEAALIGALGDSHGRRLFALANGFDDRPVEVDRGPKSISHEETFATNKVDHSELHTELVRQSDAVASRLRASNIGARTLSIKVRFDDGFRTITRSVTAPEPVDLGQSIVGHLEPLLAEIDPSPGVRLFGVAASGFGPVRRQLSLDDLADTTNERVAAATAAVDAVRGRFGSGVIGPASGVDRGRLRVVRRGQQQWGPGQQDDLGSPR